jgi:hypothetical protein
VRGMGEEFINVYQSKTTNAIIRTKNKPNPILVAQAILKLTEELNINKNRERGVI